MIAFHFLQRPQPDPPALQLPVFHPEALPEFRLLLPNDSFADQLPLDAVAVPLPDQHVLVLAAEVVAQVLIVHLQIVSAWFEVAIEGGSFALTEAQGHEAITVADDFPEATFGPQVAFGTKDDQFDLMFLGSPSLAGGHRQSQCQAYKQAEQT